MKKRILVTGIGPRTGTSAMMNALIKEGWKPKQNICVKYPSYCSQATRDANPEGLWDMSNAFVAAPHPASVCLEHGEVIKVWAGFYQKVDLDTVDVVVCMYRDDYEAQKKSIYENDEHKLLKPGMHKILISAARKEIQKYFETKKIIIRVETEELRNGRLQVLRNISLM